MSVYFNSLEGDAKSRYLAKISLIDNVDPYYCEISTFSSDAKYFPNIEHGDIHYYLVEHKSAYSNEEFKAFKSLEAYKYFKCGWVKEIVATKIGDNILVLAKVLHSPSKKQGLQPWFIAKPDGEILCGHCDCVAGLSETCSHVVAVMFAIGDVKLHEEVSCTGVKTAWGVPRSKVGEPMPRSDAIVKKRRKSIQKYEIQDMTDEEEMTLLRTCRDAGIISPALLTTAPFCFELAEELRIRETTGMGNPLQNLFKEDHCSLNLEELIRKSRSYCLSITVKECKTVEEKTREQSGNEVWRVNRIGRITASNFKKACCTSLKNPAKSTIRTICYPQKVSSGCRHEKDALKAYIQKATVEHSDFTVESVGLILSPEFPQFGATPDAVVSCSCCGNGCVEVKCPHCRKDSLLEKEKKGSLSHNHEYYYEVQMQMAICGNEYCDFVVWTGKNCHTERIYANEEFWENESEKATNFWRSVILPELFAKYYTRDVPLSRAEPTASTSVEDQPQEMLWCFCRKPDDGSQMIECNNDACNIKWYHMRCLKMKTARKTWFCSDCTSLGMTRKKKSSKQQ